MATHRVLPIRLPHVSLRQYETRSFGELEGSSHVTSKNGISARAAIAALTLFSGAGYAQSNLPWTGTWSVAPQQTTIDASFNNLAQQTLRQILHTSIGGTAARVQISNAFGQQPLVVSDVHIARAVVNSDGSPTSSTVAGTDVSCHLQRVCLPFPFLRDRPSPAIPWRSHCPSRPT